MKNKSTYLLSLVLLIAFIFNPYGTNIFELPKIQFLTISTSIIAISLVIYFLYKGKITIRYNKIVFIFLGLWLLSLVLSTVFSIAPKLSFWGSYSRIQGLSSHLVYLLFFVVFLNFLKTKKQQEIFLKALVAVASITALHAILQQFGIMTFKEYAMSEFSGRSFATFGHPNFLGQFLIFPIWGALYLTLVSERRKKIIPALLTILLIIGLLLTKNRASLLGVLVGALFIIIFSLKIKKSYKYFIAIGCVAAFVLFLSFFAPSLRSLFTRLYLWEGALDILSEHPGIGSGLETFQIVFQKAASTDLFSFEKLYEIADRAHNQYLDILITQGGFGLLTYISIIIGIFYSFFRGKNRKNIIVLAGMGAFISILASDFFSFPLTSHYLLMTAMLAIILNNTEKFKDIKIERGIILAFFSGILVTLSIIASIYATKTIYADNLFQDGIWDMDKKNITQGVNKIKKATDINKHQSDIYYHLVDVLSSLGKEAESKEILEKADALLEKGGEFTNRDFVYYLLKAMLSGYLGNYSEAEELFQKASELAPVNPLIIKEWGRVYYLRGDYEKTIEKLEQFLDLLPEYWQWKTKLDQLSFEDKEKYRLFVKHIPNFDEILIYLAESYKRIGNQEKADYYWEFVD